MTCHKRLWAIQRHQQRPHTHQQWFPKTEAPSQIDPITIPTNPQLTSENTKLKTGHTPSYIGGWGWVRGRDLQKQQTRWKWTCRRRWKQSFHWDVPRHGLEGKAPCHAVPYTLLSPEPPRLLTWLAHIAASGSPGCPVPLQTSWISHPSPQTTCTTNLFFIKIKMKIKITKFIKNILYKDFRGGKRISWGTIWALGFDNGRGPTGETGTLSLAGAHPLGSG